MHAITLAADTTTTGVSYGIVVGLGGLVWYFWRHKNGKGYQLLAAAFFGVALGPTMLGHTAANILTEIASAAGRLGSAL